MQCTLGTFYLRYPSLPLGSDSVEKNRVAMAAAAANTRTAQYRQTVVVGNSLILHKNIITN